MGERLPFFKMNGIGNDIVVADRRSSPIAITPAAAVAIAQAVPFDQIMEVAAPAAPGRDADIRILNRDGSLAEACGNGTRCVALWLAEGAGPISYAFRIAGRDVSAELREDGRVRVDMGRPRLRWQDIPLAEEFADTTGIELQIGPIDAPILHTPSVVSMGNPHAVFWVKDDPDTYALDRFGPLLENHPIFPERANITLARVEAPDRIRMRTWERGAGLTRACGSAACATLVAAARKGLTGRAATMVLPGGELLVEWDEASGRVFMTGPAEFEFEGWLDAETGAVERAGAAA